MTLMNPESQFASIICIVMLVLFLAGGCSHQIDKDQFLYSVTFTNLTGKPIDNIVLTFGKYKVRGFTVSGIGSGTEGLFAGPFPETAIVDWVTSDSQTHTVQLKFKEMAPTNGCDIVEVRFLKDGTARIVYETFVDRSPPSFFDPLESTSEREARETADKLCLAAEKGDLETLLACAKQGADLNWRFHGKGQTALEKAFNVNMFVKSDMKGKYDCAKYLLENGAVLGDALEIAASEMGPEFLQLLQSHAKKNKE